MILKILEFFGLWKSPEAPVILLGGSTCETLDSMVLLKIVEHRRRSRKRRI
jgi:hypothetical protein